MSFIDYEPLRVMITTAGKQWLKMCEPYERPCTTCAYRDELLNACQTFFQELYMYGHEWWPAGMHNVPCEPLAVRPDADLVMVINGRVNMPSFNVVLRDALPELRVQMDVGDDVRVIELLIDTVAPDLLMVQKFMLFDFIPFDDPNVEG